MQVRSSYNLKQHYKAKHPGLVEELLKALALDSKRGKVCSSSTKPGIRAEFDQGACLDPSIIATEFSQKIAQDLYCRHGLVKDEVDDDSRRHFASVFFSQCILSCWFSGSSFPICCPQP